MANLTRDLGVGVVTTVLGLTGGWFLQDQQGKAQIAAAELAAKKEAADQKALYEQELARERAKQAEERAHALYGQWGEPAFESTVRSARTLVRNAGRRNYAEIMDDPSVPEAQKEALRQTLQFFSRIRAYASEHDLDVDKSRHLFQDDTEWWAQMGMRTLLQRWTGPLPGELESAAYGIAALGGDLRTLSPPLDANTLQSHLGLGRPLTAGVARFAIRTAPAAAALVQPASLQTTTEPEPAPEALTLFETDKQIARPAPAVVASAEAPKPTARPTRKPGEEDPEKIKRQAALNASTPAPPAEATPQ
jgi:hypothetical protein